jgi:hypothetical protein
MAFYILYVTFFLETLIKHIVCFLIFLIFKKIVNILWESLCCTFWYLSCDLRIHQIKKYFYWLFELIIMGGFIDGS